MGYITSPCIVYYSKALCCKFMKDTLGQNEELSRYVFVAVKYFYPKLRQLYCSHCLYCREAEKRYISATRGAQVKKTSTSTGSCVQKDNSKNSHPAMEITKPWQDPPCLALRDPKGCTSHRKER